MKIPPAVISLMEEDFALEHGAGIPMDPAYAHKLEQNAELVVHSLAQEVAGFVFFYCNDPGRKSSYITFLLTAQSARRQGIASALVDYVLAISRRRGFRSCQLEVTKGNNAAVQLYKSMGFYPAADHGEKWLMCINLSEIPQRPPLGLGQA